MNSHKDEGGGDRTSKEILGEDKYQGIDAKFYVKAKKKYSGKGKGYNNYLAFKRGVILAILDENEAEGLYYGRLILEEEGASTSPRGNTPREGWFPQTRVGKLKEDELSRLGLLRVCKPLSPPSSPKPEVSGSPKVKDSPRFDLPPEDESNPPKTRGSFSKRNSWKRLSGNMLSSMKLSQKGSNDPQFSPTSPRKPLNESNENNSTKKNPTAPEKVKRDWFGSARKKGAIFDADESSPVSSPREDEGEGDKIDKKQKRRSLGSLMRLTGGGSASMSLKFSAPSGEPKEPVRKKSGVAVNRKSLEATDRKEVEPQTKKTSAGSAPDLNSIIEQAKKQREQSVEEKPVVKKPQKNKKLKNSGYDPEDSGPRSAPNLHLRVEQYKRQRQLEEEANRSRSKSDATLDGHEGNDSGEKSPDQQTVVSEEKEQEKERDDEEKEKEKEEREREEQERIEREQAQERLIERVKELEKQQELLKQKFLAKALAKSATNAPLWGLAPDTGSVQSAPNLQRAIAQARQEMEERNSIINTINLDMDNRAKEEKEKEKRRRSKTFNLDGKSSLKEKGEATIDFLQQILEDIAGWEEENLFSTEKEEGEAIAQQERRNLAKSLDVENTEVDQDSRGLKHSERTLSQDSEPKKVKQEVYPPPPRSKSGPLVRPKQILTMPPKANSAAAMPINIKGVKLKKTVVPDKQGDIDADLQELKRKAEEEALKRNKNLERLNGGIRRSKPPPPVNVNNPTNQSRVN